jgi:hypothetical protein
MTTVQRLACLAAAASASWGGAGLTGLTETCAAEAAPQVSVRPLHAGVCQLGEDQVLGDLSSPHERLPCVIHAFLVEDPQGGKLLVDLGGHSPCSRAILLDTGAFGRLSETRDTEIRYEESTDGFNCSGASCPPAKRAGG